MKALSIKEPWISLIAKRKKTIETRTWKTNYRGTLVLVGSKKPEGPYSGKAACFVRLIDCRPMTKDDEEAAKCELYGGAWAWVLEHIRLAPQARIRGRLGIYPAIGICADCEEDYPFNFCFFGDQTRCQKCNERLLKEGKVFGRADGDDVLKLLKEVTGD